jgi:hypothetical protein
MARAATAFLQRMSLGNDSASGNCALPDGFTPPKTGGHLVALDSKLSCSAIGFGADPLHPKFSFRRARLHSNHISYAEGDRNVPQYGSAPRGAQKVSPNMKGLAASIQPIEANVDIRKRCYWFWQSSRSHTREFP